MAKKRRLAGATNKKPSVAPKKASTKKVPGSNGRVVSQEWIYALDPAQIQVNDIVLISSANVASWIVRKGTRSHFGHAALCTRLGMLFEAVSTGVMRRSVIGTFTTRREWIKVLRPAVPLGVNVHGREVAHYAERMYGRAYSIRRAASSVFGWIDIADDGSTFCSRVIAEAYRDYGIELIPDKHPSKVYPALLLKSPALVDATEQSIRKLGSKSDRHLFQEVVATAEQELPGNEMQLNRDVFEAIRVALGDRLPKEAVSLPDVWQWLALNSLDAESADSVILQILKREGFVDWYVGWAQDVQDQAQLFENIADLAEQAGNEPKPPGLREFIQQMQEYLALDETSLRARKETMDQFTQWAQATGLSTLKYLEDKYRGEYAIFERLNRANRRLLSAVVIMTAAPT
jgi:hypothetical protein